MKNKIKIFLSYHKESEIIKSEILQPIQVGVEKNKVKLDMLADNVGENISEKNDKYCELTAQYWVWKNVDADYYGFMHYRRQFVFRDVPYYPDDGGLIHFEKLDDNYIKEVGLDDESIKECVGDYDVILPPAVNTASWGAISNEMQFSCLDNLHARDFDTVCKTIIELYPEYEKAVTEFRKGHYSYWYNMFIMKKEIFNNYCEWLFNILEASEKKVDFSEYDMQETRTLAFMAERLLSIYIIKLLKDKPYTKLKNLKITFVKYTERDLYDKIEILEKQKDNYDKPYVYCAERAYKEMKSIALPYEIRELLYEDKNIEKLLNKNKIIFYGAGLWCRHFLYYFKRLGIKLPVEIWDRAAVNNQVFSEFPISVIKPDYNAITSPDDTVWIITLRNLQSNAEVRALLENVGVFNIIENRQMRDYLDYKLWEDIFN